MKKILAISITTLIVLGCQEEKRLDFNIEKVDEGKFTLLCDSVQQQLGTLVDERNYYFKNTSQKDALAYLEDRKKTEGLSDSEIEALEKKLKINFPSDFKIYLSKFGKNSSDLFNGGQDIIPEKFSDYQYWGKELLKESRVESVNLDSIFVFTFHQRETFHFFEFGDQGDLHISTYTKGDLASKIVYHSFQEMLRADISKLLRDNDEGKDSDGYFVIISDDQIKFQYPSKNSGEIPRVIGDSFID